MIFFYRTFTKVMTSLLVTSNMDVRCKQGAVIEFLRHEIIKEAEIVERFQKVYKDKALSRATVCRWLDMFKSPVLKKIAMKKTLHCHLFSQFAIKSDMVDHLRH